MADYIKTFATICQSDVLDAINDDTNITTPCVQIIDTDDGNMTFQFDSTISGAEETALDALLAGWSCPTIIKDNQANAFIDEQSYEGEESKIIDLPDWLSDVVIHVSDPAVVMTVGSSLISPKGTGWDPSSVSGTITQINNGVYTDLAYNNLVAGNTEGIILGIDMGSAVTINSMKRWDYSTAYYDKHWEFIGTNNSDGSGYEVIFEVEQKSPYLDPNPYEKAFSDKTYRYFGCRCSESFNASYTIVRELELYSGGSVQTVEQKLANSTDYGYSKISNTQIMITNLSENSRTLKVIVVGA